ncbi:MAG: hypothetical protein GC185_06570 [Alphaproteobacteria bacterium]|nr:hypothetical protein [Alphaproteobacteria bacterium]
MKKFIALTALALVFAAPGLCHADSMKTDSQHGIDKTMTVVEQQAIQQGFEKSPGEPLPAKNGGMLSPTGLAPVAPAAAPVKMKKVKKPAAPKAPVVAAPAAPAEPAAKRPSLIRQDDLPKGLVMDGPGTPAYKKKHHHHKAKKAVEDKKVMMEEKPATPAAKPMPAPAPAPDMNGGAAAVPAPPMTGNMMQAPATPPEMPPEAAMPPQTPPVMAAPPVMDGSGDVPPMGAPPAINDGMPAPDSPAMGGDGNSDTWNTNQPDTSAPGDFAPPAQ